MQNQMVKKQESMAKVWSIDCMEAWQGEAMATVGMFDGVHEGHRQIVSHLLAEAARRGLRPLVVTFANHPRLALGREGNDFRMLTTREERLSLLSAVGVSDVVEIEFNPQIAQLSACDFMEQVLCRRLGVKALLLGYDNMFGNKQHNDFYRLPEKASLLGVSLLHDTEVCQHGEAVSSSKVRGALREGDVERANEMLGYAYTVMGEVVHGRHVGRTLGFPTANVDMAGSLKALPDDGVYAVEVALNGRRLKGMANVGAQPTFGLATPTLEVNLFDFDEDIYGEQLKVSFLRRLRPVKQFANLQELVCQLETDREEARQ